MSSEHATNLMGTLSQSVQRVKLCNAIKFQQYKNIRFSDNFISSPIFAIDYILAKCKNEQQLQKLTVAVLIYVKSVIHQT